MMFLNVNCIVFVVPTYKGGDKKYYIKDSKTSTQNSLWGERKKDKLFQTFQN